MKIKLPATINYFLDWAFLKDSSSQKIVIDSGLLQHTATGLC